MTPDRWNKIESLYNLAVDRHSAERLAFLDEACRGDDDLRREVESLLAQHASREGVLDSPALDLLGDSTKTALVTGSRLGPYQITGVLGAGGMGLVYKAQDTRLGRDVAIKISAEQFSERFEHEARAVAALNHPNICTLHDVGPNYLVMELVEGTSLSDRIKEGPLPKGEALAIAKQIANALEAAHEKGIIHRDIKPANVKLKLDGTVKVLDFGLAKQSLKHEQEDTATTLTEPGTIVGTAAYMSPEQALGKPVDKRADIWAFGCVLYEMLAGKRLFKGASMAEILAEVLRAEPDLSQVPANVRRLLRHCLEKDSRMRLRDIGDAWELLENVEAPPSPSRATAWMVTSAALTIALAMTGTALWRSTRPVQHPLVRLSVDLGPQAIEGLNSRVAISPDGQRIVFAARGLDGKQQLASRLLDQAESELLPGTQDGSDPFFSPDGQWIGFFSSSQLKKVPVRGGAPIILSAAPQLFGASWGEDGNIVAALSQVGPLSVVPAVGGVPKLITKLPADETNHRWPQILPRAQAVLFTASPTITLQENAKIETVSLKTGKVTVLERSGYHGRYVPTGHLVYVHQGVLFGIRFDPAKPEVRGIPTPIVEDLAADPVSGSGQFDFSGAASGTGTLVYLAGKRSIQTPRVSWLDSAGNAQPLISAPGEYSQPRLSPDGGQLAFMSGGDIYIYESERGTKTRLTFTGNANYPIWSPDGKHIAFRRDIEVWWIRSDGAGNPLKLLTNQSVPVPSSFTPDGRWLAYHDQDSATGQDLWTLPLDLSNPESPNAGKPQSFLRSGANELLPRFSPDGRWIAYRSDESGANEIYVRPFPAASAGKWQISNGGGLYAFWSKNGHELFYESSDNRIMVVDYTVASGSFVPGRPRLWLDQRLFTLGTSNLDLAPDGKRFAVLTAPETAGEKTSVHVTMLLNFFDEIRRRVPVK